MKKVKERLDAISNPHQPSDIKIRKPVTHDGIRFPTRKKISIVSNTIRSMYPVFPIAIHKSLQTVYREIKI